MGKIINGKKHIYIVDDAFISPAASKKKDNDKIFYNNELQDFTNMSDEMWTDVIVKNLCSLLISKDWFVYGFSHPNHLLEKLEDDSSMGPAIIIYDWDYPDTNLENENKLKEILSNYPVYIFIYTGCDKTDTIRNLIYSEDFHLYKRRISILEKNINGESSVDKLTSFLNDLIQQDFSFKFGSNMRKILLKGIDKTLSNFSSMNISNVLKLLNGEQNEDLSKEIKRMLADKIISYIKTSKDVNNIMKELTSDIKIINEIKNILSSKIENNIISTALIIDKSNTNDKCNSDEAKTLMRELWAYRLYNNPTDNVVRTGDIIRKKGSANYNSLYMIITDNCSLTRFKSKTAGLLNTIELKPLKSFCQDEIKAKNITSLTNTTGFSKTNGRPLLLPYINLNKKHVDYILYMQNHKCIQVEVDNYNEKDPLLYDDKFEYEIVCSISSEFLHPLIGTIINNLYGWGCEDYSQIVQKDIESRCSHITEMEATDE